MAPRARAWRIGCTGGGDRGRPNASISVSPPAALMDEPVTVSLRGLPADARTTVTAKAVDSEGTTWSSSAQFQASSAGEVSLGQPSLGGSYSGINPMGLFTLMAPPPGSAPDWFLYGEAGYPNGLTLGFATLGSGRLAAGRKPIEASLARAGIDLKVTTNREWEPHIGALGNPAKRLEHQLGQGGWILDYLGDNARQTILPQYDSRLGLRDNFSEYHNPAVNRLIDRALAEPDPARRAALWAEIDQRIMRDAPLVPLLWENHSFQWASRVHGWRYDPWATGPDLTAVWLDPPGS
jgi:ABC-type transport system substrate-binding protein